MRQICKKQITEKLRKKKGIWFHIIGFISVIWFALRVLPAPHRSQYPCQQVAMPVAFGYIAFWSALLFGLMTWIKKFQKKTFAFAPALLIIFILLMSISGTGYARLSYQGTLSYKEWMPMPKQPIGNPTGLYPGRVVWTWDPNATEKHLDGFWWEPQNNNPDVIDLLFSQGIQSLTNSSSDRESWDRLFTYFNIQQEKGNQTYSSGEKIAIKVNLNNCWNPLDYINDYKTRDNERDTHPYLVKSLLAQLIDVVGVEPTLITVYDSSRPMPDWFFNPIYESFPEVKYVDAFGDASGRIKAQPSEKIFYFSDGVQRTIPLCVAEADYLINMPIMKQHPINHGVTLSGKNLFGTFLEPVFDIHPYHESGQIVGNPAPQVDLLASSELGGKTILYIGDGLHATLNDHRTIYHFQMEPFYDDWTNSLFFSQDPIAIDSVMYDFLHTEGPIPIEGSQNYLHQGAEPSPQTYDPEDDGVYLSEGIGVHEHWDTSFSVFSSERYSGPTEDGIDFIAKGHVSEESVMITIKKPAYHHLYISNEPKHFSILWKDFYTFPTTIIIGSITINSEVNPSYIPIDHVEFYIDDILQIRDTEKPYEWQWNSLSFGTHTLSVKAVNNDEILSYAEREVFKLF